VLQASPPADSFAKQAALFSLLAPFVSFGIGIFGQAAVRGSRAGAFILGCVSTFLILAGFVLGIVALCGMKKHGRKGILGKAVAGVCINGILVLGMVLAIPMFIKLANQAKAAQAQQQMEQQH
jgi:riboflavin transporter FmnP